MCLFLPYGSLRSRKFAAMATRHSGFSSRYFDFNFRIQSMSCGQNMSPIQRAKKVVSGSPGLVDLAVGLVNSVINLPDGQVNFLGGNSNYRRTVINPAHQIFGGLVEMTFGLVHASYSLPEWQAVKLTFFAHCNISVFIPTDFKHVNVQATCTRSYGQNSKKYSTPLNGGEREWHGLSCSSKVSHMRTTVSQQFCQLHIVAFL